MCRNTKYDGDDSALEIGDMDGVIDFAGDLVRRFDPNSPVNLTLFFAWVITFILTFTGVWRAPQHWVRLLCYAVNQVASFGMLQAGILTLAIIYGHWREAIAAAALTLVASCWLFRDRRRTYGTRERAAQPTV